jgi:hypothetical protein
MSSGPQYQEWQRVGSDEIYVMVSKDEWERQSEIAKRAADLLKNNQRADGSVGKDVVNDAIGILEDRW